jgi:hypothetical protein
MAEEPSAPQEQEAPNKPPAEPAPTEAAQPAAAAAAPPPKPKPPPRELPSEEEIATWVQGADLPSLANLFNTLALKKYDALVMQIRKAELVPQHWQVIASTEPPDEALFDTLPSVAKLRRGYGNADLAGRRLTALRTAWVELRGLQPSLWTTPDLFAAMRRIIDKKIDIDFHELLSAARDVWRNLDLPSGKENLEILWASLAFVRGKTKK